MFSRIDKILAGLPENARLRSDIIKLVAEIDTLKEEVSSLSSKLEEANKKINSLTQENNKLKNKQKEIPEISHKILKFLSESNDEVSSLIIASNFNISIGEARNFLSILLEKEFVRYRPESTIEVMEEYEHNFEKIPETYTILTKGRSYLLKK